MARLIAALIRHGEYQQLPHTPSAHQPFPLDATGMAQCEEGAASLAAAMAHEGWRPWPVIDSSRMLRAWQTADILLHRLRPRFPELARIESFNELAERGLGCAANLSIDRIDEILAADPRHEPPPPGWKADSHYRLPLQGAESLMDAGRRVAGHLRRRMLELEGASEDTVRLFVGHGAAFRHAAHQLGVLPFEEIARLSMHHARPVYLEMLDRDRWRMAGGAWKQRRQGAEARD